MQDFIASRSRAAWLIENGLVTSAGRTLKPSHKVQAEAQIEVQIPASEPSELRPLDRPLEILHEDGDVVVVNKPSGLVVHPAAGHGQDTLVNILLHHVGQLSMGFSEKRPGIVHRLDRDTSGILVVAKNDLAHHHLAAQFRDKSAHRIYWAIVHGVPKFKTTTWRTHLARHPQDRKRFASQSKGKLAITHARLVQTAASGLSWLRLQLETGRTHQIRVHLSENHLPIVGDPIYGRKTFDRYDRALGRLALHAVELGFTHPRSGERLMFRQEWPEQIAGFLRDQGFKDV
jgi:23S rRNA pseudouridine1911/1915/1917 synthase